MKNILFLTDFSETSRNALLYGVEMFHNQNVQFFLLNAYDMEYVGSPYSAQIKEELAKESMQGLQNEYNLLKEKHAQLKMNLLSEYGSLVDVIRKISEKDTHTPDLIILGCRGETVVENILLGSNAFDVIKHIDTPIIVVPKDCKFYFPQKIAFATDLKTVDEKVVASLKDMISKFNSELVILNIVKGKNINLEEAETHFMKYFDNTKVDFKFISDTDIRKSILNYVSENNIDMIALVRYNYPFIERFFKPSITKKVMMRSHTPMIIFHTTPNN